MKMMRKAVNPVIKSKSGKETTSIYTRDGKEIIEVRNNQNNIVYSAIDEIYGSVPLSFMSRGEYLQDYRIYGNTVQNGTPTPENPVEVQGCGERTENLFDVKSFRNPGNTTENSPYFVTSSEKYAFSFPVDIGETYILSFYTKNINVAPSVLDCCVCYGQRLPYSKKNNNLLLQTKTTDVWRFWTIKFTATDDWISIQGLTTYFKEIMLTKGSTSPDNYIPYGYKIPVTVSDGTDTVTIPVYIGSEPLHKIGDYADYIDFNRGVVVRNIKKFVLTGAENFAKNDSFSTLYYLSSGMPKFAIQTAYCTHLPSLITYYKTPGCYTILSPTSILLNFGESIMDAQPSGNTAAGMKEYLAAQYSAGTPVTVWCALAEPEEEPLENLLPIQTIKGSDVLTVDTTVQPSEIYIKGKIKSLATHMLIDSGNQILISSDGYTLVTKE